MSEDNFLKQLALATIADNRARQVGSSVDFGMDDMPPIPDFLQRPWTEEEKKRQRFIVQQDADRREHPGKYIKMPTTATKHLKNGKKRKALYSIARENELDPLKWDHLNVGQVAMNLSNVLRSRYYKMEDITINGVVIP